MLEKLAHNARGRRCSVHGLAVAADGRCILCRRDQRPRPRPASVWAWLAVLWGVLAAGGVAAALVIGGAPAAGQLSGRSAPVAAEPPSPAPTRPSPALAPTIDNATTAEPLARTREPSPSGRTAVDAPGEERRKPAVKPRRRRRARPQRRPAVRPVDPSASEREALAARRRMDAAYQRHAVQQALGRVPIRVYVTSWCRACRSARQWLRQNNIPAQEINIETSPGGRQALLRLNRRGTIPTFDIDGQVLIGFSPRRVQQAILRAVQRHRTPM